MVETLFMCVGQGRKAFVGAVIEVATTIRRAFVLFMMCKSNLKEAMELMFYWGLTSSHSRIQRLVHVPISLKAAGCMFRKTDQSKDC